MKTMKFDGVGMYIKEVRSDFEIFPPSHVAGSSHPPEQPHEIEDVRGRILDRGGFPPAFEHNLQARPPAGPTSNPSRFVKLGNVAKLNFP